MNDNVEPDGAANPRAAEQSDGSDHLSATLAADRAFSAAVDEFGRQAIERMNSYRDAAVEAAKWTGASPSHTPADGWLAAVARRFPESASSRNKSCPRGAFLGLCEEGFVIGVARGHYTRSKKNKAYAVAGVQLLFREPKLADDILGLWRRVIRGESMVHNHQMDVVIGLWNAGLIARSNSDIA